MPDGPLPDHPGEEALKRADRPENQPSWRATLWLAALALLGGIGLSVVYGVAGYRSLLTADVLPWRWLPALLHGVVAELCIVGGVVTLLWAPPRLARAAAVALWLAFSVVATLQVLSLRLSAGYLSVQALAHAELALSLATPASVAIAVALPLSMLLVGVGAARWWRVRQWTPTQRGLTALLLFGVGGWGASPARVDAVAAHLSGATTAELRRELTVRYGMITGTPVAALWQTLGEIGEADVIVATAPTRAQLEQAAAYGLVLRPEAALPLAHARIADAPFPHRRRPTAVGKPNLIVIFAESLSAHLLESYGGRHPGLTPNLSAMAASGLQVDDWFNHVTPTVTGLRGQLCGLWPRLSFTPWKTAKRKLRTAKVFCLPHLLAERGWRTIYWNHGRPHVTYIKAQAIDWGFQELLFHAEVSERWLQERPKSRQHGVSDQQMMRALARFVSEADKPGDSPFFLAVSTIETHVGFDLDDDGQRYARGPTRSTILDTFHNFDAAFGRFWRAFMASPRAKDTIVIVTADHALYPSDLHRAVAGPGYLNHKFGRTALLIADPTHELPHRLDANATSVDFAPTVAHMLQITERETPWLGRSIFGDRQKTAGALGFIYGKHLLTIDARGAHIDDQPPRQAEALRAVLTYTQALEAQGRIWR